MKNIRRLLLLIWVPVMVGLVPRSALAIQPHGPPEGLYVHQMAHVLFAGAMLFFIFLVQRRGLKKITGFRLLSWACGLLVLWNLDAFLGHLAEGFLSPQAFQGQAADFSQRLCMSGPESWVYYFAKMDHLILVPAFYLLYRGLNALARTHEMEEI
jgi:hypothetical protein